MTENEIQNNCQYAFNNYMTRKGDNLACPNLFMTPMVYGRFQGQFGERQKI